MSLSRTPGLIASVPSWLGDSTNFGIYAELREESDSYDVPQRN